jgi:hypothetical protein
VGGGPATGPLGEGGRADTPRAAPAAALVDGVITGEDVTDEAVSGGGITGDTLPASAG